MSSSEHRLHSPTGNPETGSSANSLTATDSLSSAPIGLGTEERSPIPGLSDFPEEVPPLFPIAKSKGRTTQWIWLIALASLGLHAGVLLIPTGEGSKPTPPKPPEQQIRITQLPNLTKQPTIKPPAKPIVKRTLPQTVNRPQSVRSTPPPIPSAKPPSSKPLAASPAVNAANGENPWQDFPLYPGSQPGCFELPSCLQISDSLSQVAAYFAKELPGKKYEAKRMIQEPGREVYQVSRNGLTQFLSLIVNGNNTVYVLSDAPRSLSDLEKAVEVPPEIYAILVGLAVQQADPSYFAQPDQFYSKADGKGLNAGSLVPRSGIRNISLVTGQAADTMMDEFLRSNLQNSKFEVTDLPQPYSGGKVYQLQKQRLTLYLNLVPTKDNSGTLIVIWKTPPA